MSMQTRFQWWKLIVGYLFFLFFHEVYGMLGGGTLASILGEGIESIYSHMKMYFYAYLLVALIEYFLRRKSIPSAESFWYSRMLIAAAFPWMSIAIWFVPEALGLDISSFELPYSLAMTVIGLYFAFLLDDGLGLQLRPALKAFIWIAFAAAVITYVGFSFHVPDNFFIAA
jgi:hypothetical protein